MPRRQRNLCAVTCTNHATPTNTNVVALAHMSCECRSPELFSLCSNGSDEINSEYLVWTLSLALGYFEKVPGPPRLDCGPAAHVITRAPPQPAS